MMKNVSGLVLICVFIFIGCYASKKAPRDEKKLPVKHQEYAKGEFRRFTYSLNSNNTKTEELLRGVNWERINKQAKQFGIYGAKCYKKDTEYFFILDAKPTFNSEATLKSFEQTDAIRTLIKNLKSINQEFLNSNSALERMYKLDQRVVYKPFDGQLKTDIGAHKRYVWTLLLNENPTLLAEYKQAHSMGHAWPQITKNMKFIGVKDMEIYLDGYRAVLIMDTKPDFDMDISGPKWQKLPKEKEWQEHVAKFQRTKPGSSIQEKWQDMEKL